MEKNEETKKERQKKNNIIRISAFLALYFLIFIIPIAIGRNEISAPVVKVLSNEETAAFSGTTKERTDNSDIWETENNDVSKTTVMVSEAAEVTCVTVVFPLDINSASKNELVFVRGIGEVLAERIVDYRNLNGYFYSLDELLNVDGIGEKKLDLIKDYFYINYEYLPETLARSQVSSVAGTEYEIPVTTSVPGTVTEKEERQTVVVTTEATEDFAMETEEFITDSDDDTEEYDEDDEYFYSTKKSVSVTTEEYYPDFPLDLNKASAEDLMYIKGIGKATANKIVEYARTVGFHSVEDLLNISGIGSSKLAMIAPYVYVDPAFTTYDSGSDSLFTTSEGDGNITISSVTDNNTENSEIYSSSNEIYRVNINTCGKADLMQLPGIDEELAENILALRNELGYFIKIEELSFADKMTNDKLSAIWNYIYV